MDKYELRDEELRREESERVRAVNANKLLDLGVPREIILETLAENDDEWLKEIEAARESGRAADLDRPGAAPGLTPPAGAVSNRPQRRLPRKRRA